MSPLSSASAIRPRGGTDAPKFRSKRACNSAHSVRISVHGVKLQTPSGTSNPRCDSVWGVGRCQGNLSDYITLIPGASESRLRTLIITSTPPEEHYQSAITAECLKRIKPQQARGKVAPHSADILHDAAASEISSVAILFTKPRDRRGGKPSSGASLVPTIETDPASTLPCARYLHVRTRQNPILTLPTCNPVRFVCVMRRSFIQGYFFLGFLSRPPRAAVAALVA